MAILVREGMRVLVQGITGRQGTIHTKLMLEYGTKIVAGVTPGKSGAKVYDVPVFDSVEEAVREKGPIDASIVFVPAPYAMDAVIEAVDNAIPLVVVITEGIPVHDTAKFVSYARSMGTTIIGPNCPGIIAPGKVKIGIMPADSFAPGPVGIVSRSGTLTYEISLSLKNAGYGSSTTIGIGGDPITGLNFIEVLELFKEDPETKAVVIVGEIGGDAEERAAKYIAQGYPKPVVAYVAGRTAPPGKRMGHAGAIITAGQGTVESKERAFSEAGVPVARTPFEVAPLLAERLRH
ncbi:succinate--CoA ligase subunit alpha [Candidatus Korarchaeum cryptofilum]|jgi:succinyl-CoA synthetase alpha subunit|uniref:Succinate--CoA ligase [ADP-forming] subunit alpha n=2 Tax=Candidatus Korarchaeum cryptofilum TaxID=498846 RepID=B1L6R0_KORCO|nr:succinate--CoA ligase subunit alpha [Candidatus Korarchaeum cryptofilum]ACB08139.1 succinyl-CoA synthetase, alpha subunit [Candidatus Korarchaeum cryptofilum OPF8]RSN67306.1 succinate--CoA ligase subunit alpha [Candidatus Korarchaeum cryptofilum]